MTRTSRRGSRQSQSIKFAKSKFNLDEETPGVKKARDNLTHWLISTQVDDLREREELRVQEENEEHAEI